VPRELTSMQWTAPAALTRTYGGTASVARMSG